MRKKQMESRYSKEIHRLYLQMYPRLFEYARSSLMNDALAEEAVHDTFIIACQKPQALCNSINPEGWLVITLRHVIANTLRSQEGARRILGEYLALSSEDLSVTHDQMDFELLYHDIAEMEEFKLLKEMAMEGQSYLEISENRGISVAACRKRMQRAKEILRKKLKI